MRTIFMNGVEVTYPIGALFMLLRAHKDYESGEYVGRCGDPVVEIDARSGNRRSTNA